MTIKQLREHLEARPFRPIVVRTVSGCRHPVRHPEYLFIPPAGDSILVVDEDGSTIHHVDISHVEAVETSAKTAKSR